MPAPATIDEFLGVLRKSRVLETPEIDGFLAKHSGFSGSPEALAALMKSAGLLTTFQQEQLLRGKHRGFVLGKYKLLDRIGLGGMGQVFLAEHGAMRRRVALKVLPPDKAQNQFARERFVREARATGQLDHPNLIRAFDLDNDGDVHFLVMEYVDGISLQDLVSRIGPLDPHRAAYYLWQAASGLQYLSSRGLVHRDIKPANLIVDRIGAVKILDLGLVRDEENSDNLTQREDVRFLGTADYLAPEQMADCSKVDVRADIYALGATGYFLLTGKTPYSGGTLAQKLVAAQTTEAKAVHLANPLVPVELSTIISRMMMKRADKRFQTAAELLESLDRWAEQPPPPPSPDEFPNADAAAAPIPSSAVNLSFNVMKAARGGSSGRLTDSQPSSNLKFHSDVATKPTAPSTNVVKTPVPSPVSPKPPGPAIAPAAPAPTMGIRKSGFVPVAAAPPTPPKRKPVNGYSALPTVSGQSMAKPAADTKAAEPAPLVDVDEIKRKLTTGFSDATEKPPETPRRGFLAFLKSLFSRKSPAEESVSRIRDSARL